MAKYTPVPIATTLSNSAANTINNNLQSISVALEKTLSRDGTTPNQMTADLDINNNDVINVANLDADLVSTQGLYIDGKRVIPGSEISGLGTAAFLDVGTTAGTVAAGDDARIVGALQPADFPETSYAVPIGGGNQSPVPRDIADRAGEHATLRDFGIELFETDGVTLKDNTTELQEMFDKLQPYNATVWVENLGQRYGATTLLTGPLTLRDSGTYGGRPYEGAGLAIIGETVGDRAAWATGRYDLGQGFKQKPGTTGTLFNSAPKAGHLVLENLLLASEGGAQCAVDLQDRTDGQYGYGAFITQCYILGFAKGGLRIGANRGRGATDWMWIEYSGTAGAEPALFQGCYDWEHIGIGLGVNNGPACYIGAVSQVRFFGGAMWMSEYGAIVSEDCDNVDFFGVHFDQHKKDGVRIKRYNGTGRKGSRRFVGCRWSDNSDLTDNTYSDIYLEEYCDDVMFVSPAFEGKAEAAARQKYNVETEAGAIFHMDGTQYDTGSRKPYKTAFTNDWSRVRIGGTGAIGLGAGNGGASTLVMAAGVPVAEFRDTGVSLGDVHGLAPLRTEKISGGTHNRVLVQSTTSTLNWPLISVESGFADANLVLSGKGNGRVHIGPFTAAADAVSNGYIEIYDSASGTVKKVMTRA